jgi:YVTN family beta-propeller protein
LLLSEDDNVLVVARAFRSFYNEDFDNLYANLDEGVLSPRITSIDLSCYSLERVSDGAVFPVDGNIVSILDTADLSLVDELQVGRGPVALVLGDTAQRYFTASRCEPELDHFDAATLTLETLPLVAPATAMAVSSDGSDVFVAHIDSLSVVDASTRDIEVGAAAGIGVADMVYVDVANALYVSRPGLDRVDAVDLSDVQNPDVAGVPSAPRPGRLAVDGNDVVYALNLGAQHAPGRSITRLLDRATLDTIAVDDGPTDIAFDGNRAFVTSFGDLVPVATNQDLLRRGFGNVITEILDIDGVPTTAPLLVHDDSDVTVDGPLQIDFLALGSGERRLLHTNYGHGFTVFSYDPDAGNGRRIGVGNLPIASELRDVDDEGTARLIAFVLASGDDDGSRLSVMDLPLLDANDLDECAFPSNSDLDFGCIAFEPGLKANAMAVGDDPTGAVVIASASTDQVAVYTIAEIMPATANAATVPELIAVGDGPSAVLVSADGLFAYVANELDGTVSVIELTNRTVQTTLQVGGAPTILTQDATGRVFVGNRFDGTITIIDNQAVATSFDLPD